MYTCTLNSIAGWYLPILWCVRTHLKLSTRILHTKRSVGSVGKRDFGLKSKKLTSKGPEWQSNSSAISNAPNALLKPPSWIISQTLGWDLHAMSSRKRKSLLSIRASIWVNMYSNNQHHNICKDLSSENLMVTLHQAQARTLRERNSLRKVTNFYSSLITPWMDVESSKSWNDLRQEQ